jgi:hypothetical protein
MASHFPGNPEGADGGGGGNPDFRACPESWRTLLSTVVGCPRPFAPRAFLAGLIAASAGDLQTIKATFAQGQALLEIPGFVVYGVTVVG